MNSILPAHYFLISIVARKLHEARALLFLYFTGINLETAGAFEQRTEQIALHRRRHLVTILFRVALLRRQSIFQLLAQRARKIRRELPLSLPVGHTERMQFKIKVVKTCDAAPRRVIFARRENKRRA